MKTQLSRKQFRPERRYSAVFQQMGRMFTDADINDASQLVRERQNDALIDVIGSGTPRERGLVLGVENPDGTVTYSLRWGYAYVDGIIAQLRPTDLTVTAFDYLTQADFPGAPALPADPHRFYLDVWERAVTALEDTELRDPGLHGADTCTRTQTMAQLKWCSTTIDPSDPAQNPPIGEALISLQLRQGSTSPDPCDPCADEIALHDKVGNYLFRVEVHDVTYDSAGAPTDVILKWSSENGAEQYLANDVPPGFDSPNWLYEFFSGEPEQFASEKQLGKHLADGFAPSRGQLEAGFPNTIPAGASLVRRWDGSCQLRKSGGIWQLMSGTDRGVNLSSALAATDHGHVSEGSTVVINANTMTLSAQLDSFAMLAGDYWCQEVRQSVHSSGDVLLDAQAAVDVLHHYLDLGEMSGGNFTPVDSDACQSFVFPSLTDLRAGDICYTLPDCGTPAQPSVGTLLEAALGAAFPDPGTTDVRTILDALMCRHAATTLPLVKDNDLCAALQSPDVRSVQDALNVLCEREADGCATFTVFPRPGWEQVFDKIAPGADASICFHEGRYVLDNVVEIANKGHLTLSGAGFGTQITCNRRETALRFIGCLSVTATNLNVRASAIGQTSALDHLHGALTFVNCANVSVTDCTLRSGAGTRPGATCMTVTHTNTRSGSARITGCQFDVGHRQIGLLVVNMERATISDNVIRTRTKPPTLTLDVQLRERTVANRARKLLVNEGVVRNFSESADRGKQSIHMENNNQRRIKIASPVAASAWKNVLTQELGRDPLASNQVLLNRTRDIGLRLVTDAVFREQFSPFSRWFEQLRAQNPAVCYKGIVCAGRVASDIRITNNSLHGVQEGIHVGVSDRAGGSVQRRLAGRVNIAGNTIAVQLPPLVTHRRGGIFVGNCNHASVNDNHVTVQRFPLSAKTPIEGIRVYGRLGRMLMIRENYMSNCSTGVRVHPVGASDNINTQWNVSQNMMPGANPRVSAPNTVQQVNNRS